MYQIKYSSLAYSNELESYWVSMASDRYLECARKKLLDQIKDWEICRRFAMFCKVCNEYRVHLEDDWPNFNLTLSMGLFARFWKFDLPADWNEDGGKLKQLSWKNIQDDCLHNEIAKIVRCSCVTNVPDIYSIVFWKKRQLLRYYGAETISPTCKMTEYDRKRRPIPEDPQKESVELKTIPGS